MVCTLHGYYTLLNIRMRVRLPNALFSWIVICPITPQYSGKM